MTIKQATWYRIEYLSQDEWWEDSLWSKDEERERWRFNNAKKDMTYRWRLVSRSLTVLEDTGEDAE